MNELSARLNRLAPSATLAMSQKSSELKAQGVDVINLSVGEPDFNTPENIKKAAIKAVNDNFSHYSPVPGYPVLREAIAGKLKRENGLEYATSQILCSNGAKQSVCNVIMSIIQAGDEVIIPAPYWVSYPQMVKLAEGEPVCVSAGIEQDFKITPAQLEAAITPHTRALIICSPSNPTGTTIDFNVLDEVCRLAASRGAWRIVDETYLDLADREPDGTEVKSVLACDPDAIVCNSFSKFFGMTGWRLGWAILPDEPTVLEAVDDLATNYYLCAHTPTQHAALACFTPESLAECEARRQELLARRRIVIDGLKRIGLPVEVEPNGAFYAYFDISRTGLDAWTFCERALDEAHVALTPGRDFGAATADTHVRLSYAASREALTEGLERLGTFVESL